MATYDAADVMESTMVMDAIDDLVWSMMPRYAKEDVPNIPTYQDALSTLLDAVADRCQELDERQAEPPCEISQSKDQRDLDEWRAT